MSLFIKKENSTHKNPLLSYTLNGPLSVILLLVSPTALFWCVEFLAKNPMNVWAPATIAFNILFYTLCYLFVFFISGRIRFTLIFCDLFFILFGLVNHFVYTFRSEPVVPWDIFSVGTAASVAADYDYTLSPTALWCIAACVLLIILALFAKLPVLKIRIRFLIAVLVFFCLFGYVKALHNDRFIKYMKFDNTLFTPWFMARKNGLTTAFLMDLKYLKVEKPEGYSTSAAKALIEEAEAADDDTAAEAPEHLPNIIVVMNEAFSDPAILGDFAVNRPYMPYFNSLWEGAEDTVSGILNVSVKGGNTANTEYEFLTGNSMRYFPAGSVPYQQYIFSPKATNMEMLTELGYKKIAMHPYMAKGWNRNHVYDFFGFDELLFKDSFPDATILRKYVDDYSVYDKISEVLLEDEPDVPKFIFAVTMQNHSGYFEDFDNFDVDIHAEDCDSRILDRYLSLMKQSDDALYYLTDTLSECGQDTIIVFFGDHQPNDVVVDPVLGLYGKSSSTLGDDEYIRYQVPYIIWANYDIEEDTGIETSVNYLATHLLETAGIPLSGFQKAMKGLENEIPIISTKRLVDQDGTQLTPEEEAADQNVRSFRYLEYYRAFEEEASE